MISIRQLMIDDHNHCDDLFIEAENLVAEKKWSEASTSLKHFIAATLEHFSQEENILFPAFENETGMTSGPTEVMRQEHEQIRQLMSKLEQSLEEENISAYMGTSETLQIFMQQHNLKEEQILYPMIEQSCSKDADKLMKDFINRDKSSAA